MMKIDFILLDLFEARKMTKDRVDNPRGASQKEVMFRLGRLSGIEECIVLVDCYLRTRHPRGPAELRGIPAIEAALTFNTPEVSGE